MNNELSNEPILIVGPPGTGKTQELVDHALGAILYGFSPDSIKYLAFTRRAKEEAIKRIYKLYLPKENEVVEDELTKKLVTWILSGGPKSMVSTIHGLAFQYAGLNKSKIFIGDRIRDFARIYNLNISDKVLRYDDEDFLHKGKTEHDHMLFLMGLADVMMIPRDEAIATFPWEHGKGYIRNMWQNKDTFLEERGLFDFSQILTKFIEGDIFPKLQLLIVDEVQDLSLLQWLVIDAIVKANPGIHRMYGGDPDQSLYDWAGATPWPRMKEIMRIDDSWKIKYLAKSRRVPKAIHALANRVLRKPFIPAEKWVPRGYEGEVKVIYSLDEINLVLLSLTSTLFLARDRCFLTDPANWLKENNREYTFFTADTERNFNTLSTIHRAKGMEADTVVLDLSMTEKSWQQWGTESEDRVWYTAITRARRTLFLYMGRSRWKADIDIYV